jgi:LacI family transcriptional regulator
MATLSDVARLAGVSLSTASRALNGSRDRVVHPDLAAKALAAASQLNYAPNAAAQTMARGRSQTIALIVNDIRDPYFSSIAAGVMTSAAQSGHVVTLATTEHDREALFHLVEAMRQQRPAALVVAGTMSDQAGFLAHLRQALADFQASTGSRVCTIGQAHPGICAVNLRNRAGAAALGRRLAAQGLTSATILAGPPHHPTAARRAQGFAEGFAQTVTTVPGEFTRDAGFAAMTRLLAGPDWPQLVFAVNDVMAVGALAAARQAGVAVPGQLRLAGFDDIPTLRDISPSLTTVRVPMERLGTTAVQLALRPADARPTTVTLSCTPVLRDSTA